MTRRCDVLIRSHFCCKGVQKIVHLEGSNGPLKLALTRGSQRENMLAIVTSQMHVISYKRIRQFSTGHKDAEAALRAWYTTVKRANWQNLVELKQVYPSADLVDRYIVFNIKGNKYRLIARVVFRSQTIFVIAVMTHKEYDSGKWKA